MQKNQHAKLGALAQLIEALRCLPGVGPKSAQRMAYHLLQHDRTGAAQLAQSLDAALQGVQHCALCNTFSETEVCSTCANPERDSRLLCVVETPADQNMLEQTLSYKGLYFVLMGRLSPLDDIGPQELQLQRLLGRLQGEGLAHPVEEVILATNFTSEGEATAHYLSSFCKARGLHTSRLARGVPVGGELEYVDAGTLARAMFDRRSV